MHDDTERDDDLERAFYDAYYAGMYVLPYDDAPTALKLRLRLALELIDGLRAKQDARIHDLTTPIRPRPSLKDRLRERNAS